MNILINASNLHCGGGVQVAASIIYEISKIEHDYTISVFCSDEVFESIPKDFNCSIFHIFEILNVYGILSFNKRIMKCSKDNDISLTVFGPSYFKLKSKFNLVGFAQPWIIYPENAMYKKMSFILRMKIKLKFFIQEYFFKRSDKLIVEHDSVLMALRKKGFSKEKISVINNTVATPFLNYNLRTDLVLPDIKESFILGFLGRAYPHKNLNIIKDVNLILQHEYNLKLGFVFSLSESEMKLLSFDDVSNFYTCGPINSTQCPSFYESIDSLIFPSLLECFSASPLEAMIMGKTVFASNCPFIKDVYGKSVYYFDPLDSSDIAFTIASNIFDDVENKKRISIGIDHCRKIITAKERAIKYIELFNDVKVY